MSPWVLIEGPWDKEGPCKAWGVGGQVGSSPQTQNSGRSPRNVPVRCARGKGPGEAAVGQGQARQGKGAGGQGPPTPPPWKALQVAVPGWRAGAPWGCKGLRWAGACQCGFSVLPYQMESGCCVTVPLSRLSGIQAHFLCTESQALRTKGRLLSPPPLTPGLHRRPALISAPEQQVRKSRAGEHGAGRAAGSPGAGGSPEEGAAGSATSSSAGVSQGGLPPSARRSRGPAGSGLPQERL